MKIDDVIRVCLFTFEVVKTKKVGYCPSLTLHMAKDGLNLRVKLILDCQAYFTQSELVLKYRMIVLSVCCSSFETSLI